MIFPIPKNKYRVIETIYREPGIKISELMKKLKVSQKFCYKYLDELRNSKIIKEKTIGRTKMLYPNMSSENGKLIFSLVENQKREDFFSKYKKLRPCFDHLVKNVPGVTTILIFGSYARFAPTKESDLDLLFVVSTKKNLKKLRNLVEESFVTSKATPSSRILLKSEFTKSRGDSLFKTILRDHVCVYNSLEFVKLISKFYS